eukprot:m.219441 g.219441  ORF g.219441 m.219441 type:complete len:321 (+) comp25756_c0_seq3:5650-6612(+)
MVKGALSSAELRIGVWVKRWLRHTSWPDGSPPGRSGASSVSLVTPRASQLEYALSTSAAADPDAGDATLWSEPAACSVTAGPKSRTNRALENANACSIRVTPSAAPHCANQLSSPSKKTSQTVVFRSAGMLRRPRRFPHPTNTNSVGSTGVRGAATVGKPSASLNLSRLSITIVLAVGSSRSVNSTSAPRSVPDISPVGETSNQPQESWTPAMFPEKNRVDVIRVVWSSPPNVTNWAPGTSSASSATSMSIRIRMGGLGERLLGVYSSVKSPSSSRSCKTSAVSGVPPPTHRAATWVNCQPITIATATINPLGPIVRDEP